MFERFTDRARRAVVNAQEEARHLRHDFIGPEHMLLALAADADSVAGQALLRHHASYGALSAALTDISPPGTPRIRSHVPFSRQARTSLEMALREALRLGLGYIGTEHLLAGLIKASQTDDNAVALQILERLSVNPAALLDAVNEAESSSLPSELADVVAPSGPESIGLYLPSVSAALKFAAKESRGLGQDFVGLEHLLLGIIRAAGETSDPVASRLLEAMGADLDKVRPLALALRADGESR